MEREQLVGDRFGDDWRCVCAGIGLNSKEANNQELAEGVMEILPRFALMVGVVAIGEIGYDEQTELEDKYFRLQLELAKELELPIMIHTPHRDKKRGTTRSMDVIEEHGVPPSMVVIDHNNEETVQEVLDRGYWAAFSIYPSTKMGNERMVEIVRQYGAQRIIVDSACDWGISEPLGVAKTAKLALQRGILAEQVRLICYQNALDAYGQSGQIKEDDWLNPPAVDQRTLYEGNSIMRGGREPRVEEPRRAVEELVIE
jgi:predicted metal-dependent TIM-barrel fold hydrolase